MWGLLAGAVALLLLAADAGDGDVVEGVENLLDSITKGSRVTNAPYSKVTGVAPGDPYDLAEQAGVSLDVYALARMLASEEGRANNVTKAACAWCAVNYAGQQGKTISQLLLRAVDPNHSGRFGTFVNIDKSSPYYRENSAGKPTAADRYASTATDPYAGDVEIAAGVLDGSIPDLTGGAIQFDRPAGEANPERVAAKRIAAGRVEVAVEGADPGLRFWA